MFARGVRNLIKSDPRSSPCFSIVATLVATNKKRIENLILIRWGGGGSGAYFR